MDGKRNSRIFNCKRTVARNKKKFLRNFHAIFNRMPTDAEMPLYTLKEKPNADTGQSTSGAAAPSSKRDEQMSEESSSDSDHNNDSTDSAIGNDRNDEPCVDNENPKPVQDLDYNLDSSSNDDDDAAGGDDNDDDDDDNSDIADLGEVHCEVDEDSDDDNGNCNSRGGDGGDDCNDGVEDKDDSGFCNGDTDGDDDGDGDGDDDDDDDDDDVENDDNDEDTSAFSVREGPEITMRPHVREHEIIIAVMAVAQRFKFSLEATLAVIRLFKDFANRNTLPTTKTSLWKKLGRKENNSQTRHVYCRTCRAVIGTGKVPETNCPCESSGPEKPLSSTSYFVTLDITKQLRRIFAIPNIQHLLDHRNNRQKINPDAMEYLFDGEEYQRLRNDGEFLNSNLNFSLSINTDGCQVAVSSKESAWPVLLSINELPPHARKRFIILAGIWVDKEQPDFNIFTTPIIQELRQLFFTGIEWRPDGIQRVTSKFATILCTSDSPARAKMLNTTNYNGEYGCNFCYEPGIRMTDNSRKYPIGNINDRTDAEIRRDMEQAARTETRQRGLIGESTLKYLPELDLRRGVVVDSMHCVDIGVAKKLTELVVFEFLGERIRRIIEERLKIIRTPSGIARKPRPIALWKLWKGSEWRNWILYYCVPCLNGLIPEEYLRLFSMLSEAMHAMNSDSITAELLEHVRTLINDFETLYEEIFGIENMTTNMHLLRHLPDTVKCWGPVWAHNAYMYESFNHQILNSLNSSTGRQLQIINRYLLNDFIKNVTNDPNLNILTKELVKNILNTGKKLPVRNDADYEHYYDFRALGRPKTRNPSNRERNLLREQRLMCNDRLTVFNKAIVKGTIYSSKKSDKENTRSCDKYVYTKNGKFAEILNIVSFVTNEDDQVHGMFVKWFDDLGDVPVNAHIRSLRVSTRGFIKIQDVRLPVIILKLNGIMYGVRMANAWETD